MANSDYTVRGQGGMCPTGVLLAEIDPGAGTINVGSFQEVTGVDDLEVGMAVLVGGEVMRLQSTALPILSVLRGCADTIPALHTTGARAWFFSNSVVTDERAYTATDTIGVKLLPFSLSSGPVPMANAPALPLTFNWRFARPYPPGKLLCNGVAWYLGPHELEELDTAFEFTWAHRDRLLQADQLVGHEEDSIGPEPTTTYVAVVYNADDEVVRTVAGITDPEWSYSRTLFDVDVPTGVGRVILGSMRDGLASWQAYTIELQSTSGGGVEGGFGAAFGTFGG